MFLRKKIKELKLPEPVQFGGASVITSNGYVDSFSNQRRA